MYGQKLITLVIFFLCIIIFIDSYETIRTVENNKSSKDNKKIQLQAIESQTDHENENNSNFIHSIINADIIASHKDVILESNEYHDNKYNYINKPVKNNLRGRKPIDQILVYDTVSVRLTDYDEGNSPQESNDIDNESTNMKKKMRKKKPKFHNEGELNMIDEILASDATNTNQIGTKTEDRSNNGGNLPMKRKNKRKPRPNFENDD